MKNQRSRLSLVKHLRQKIKLLDENQTTFLLSRNLIRKDSILAKRPDTLKLSEEGKIFYQNLRCANCHYTPNSNMVPNSSKPLPKLNLSKGCLSAKPTKIAPHFHLSSIQNNYNYSPIGFLIILKSTK